MVTDVSVPTPERLQEDVQHLKEWIAKEPHLPKIDDNKWLETFLYRNKFSLEKTKSKLENYYSLRTKYPELLKNRDPASPEVLKSRKCVRIAVSEKLLKDENTWMIITKYEGNASDFDVTAYAKRFFMIMDMMLLKEERQTTSIITIHDLKEYSYLHALRSMAETGKMSEIFNNAYAERIKAVNLVNFSSFLEKPLEFSLKFFPGKLRERIHIHTATKNTLFETVGKDVLCSDFGGNGPSLAELEERTHQELEKYRKWFEEQEHVCSDESLRRKDFDQVEEMRGSFRKLEVD